MQSIEGLLVKVLSRLNYHFFTTKNYMSRIRGGHNFHMLRVSGEPVQALRGDTFEVIVALDKETRQRHFRTLAKKGIFISKEWTDEIAGFAKNTCGEVKAANAVITGLLLSILGCTEAQASQALGDDQNLTCLLKGYEFARQWGVADKYSIKPKAGEHFIFTGNQALGLGAILGGCQFMAGYPMTPSTGIMDYMAKAALKLPVHFEQGEDEIAVINMAIGAAYAGVRSMVASSGGGFALMVEGVSLAAMTETPIVIIVAQRPAPATGLPTRTEQADLNFVLHAGHGEFPRVIFAPGSIAEALTLAKRSFELADKYQLPVFILTDQYLADSVYVVPKNVIPDKSAREYEPFDAAYKRYQLTKTGISPLAFPGLSEALVQVDSDEHDEAGKITEDLDLRTRMVDKRLDKYKLINNEAIAPTYYGAKNASIILVSWGSNKLIVEEAVRSLNGEGLKLGALHFSQIFPLTERMLSKYQLEKKRLICIENNATGQFAKLFRTELGLDVTDKILKYNGECFTAEEIMDRVKKMLQKTGRTRGPSRGKNKKGK